MFDFLVDNIMMPFLRMSYGIIPNYGIAIILLTLVVKILFYPLTQKQFASMKKMQELQPKLAKLQEKFKDKPEQLQKEIMGFYKAEKVNPFSGCLPLLVQLPIFFAIFQTMNSQGFKKMLGEAGVNKGLFSQFWLTDLTLPDHLYILPVLIGLATWWSQKLTITDPNQARMMMFMPFLMVVICFKMPAGVLIYWAVSQILSTVQQIYIMRKI